MKKQITLIGSFLLMTVSSTASYASSDMKGHNMESMDSSAMDSMNTNNTSKPTTSKEQEANIKLDVYKIADRGDKKIIQVKLTGITDNKPVKSKDLGSLLIIDDSLKDYKYISTKALNTPGLYEFEWNPKKSGFIKLSAQVKIDGKELLIPFEVNIK